MNGVATLSNEKNYTVFQFGNHVIRFVAPHSLERYTAVKEWGHLYFDVDKFLNPIKSVEVANIRKCT